ncbi:MAG: biopolymer transporter ExbD [Methylotenera sp.]|nr:biopolymer transporter ExbD [Oligoflexia bacterium]
MHVTLAGHKKKRWFKKKGTVSEEASLNITSMADIFTILLVFLLKSYSSGAVSVSPTQGLLLPAAKGGSPVVEAIKIEVTSTAIQIEGKAVSDLTAYNFGPTDMESGDISLSLRKAFTEEKQKQLKTIAERKERQPSNSKADNKGEFDAKIMILADQKTPYGTLRTILASATEQGFTDFKLVVITEE